VERDRLTSSLNSQSHHQSLLYHNKVPDHHPGSPQ
jgi:hypothetical protein